MSVTNQQIHSTLEKFIKRYDAFDDGLDERIQDIVGSRFTPLAFTFFSVMCFVLGFYVGSL